MAYDGGEKARKQAHLSKEDAKFWRNRLDHAFKKQANYIPLWQAYAEVMNPERATFHQRDPQGLSLHDRIYTSEPLQIRRDLANQLGAMTRPRSKPWFNLVIRPEDRMEQSEAVQRWCDEATRVLREVIYAPSTNFTVAMGQSDGDYVTFGNAVVLHTYNDDLTGLVFRCLHLRDCAWYENASGQVDELYRKCHDMVRNFETLFGKDRLPDAWCKRMKESPDHMETLICATVPVRYWSDEMAAKAPRDAEWAMIWMTEEVMNEDKAHGVVHIDWFKVFPYWVRRWVTVSEEPYGRSPAAGAAYSEACLANRAEASIIDGIERVVSPALFTFTEAPAGEFNLRPGELTMFKRDFFDAQGSRQPIGTIPTGEPRYGMEYKADVIRRLGTAFYQHLIKPLFPEREMTAFEANERVELYIREASPIFEPIEADHSRLMEAVFLRALERGAFGRVLPDGSIEDLPADMDGTRTDFEFETPLSQAKRKRDAIAADQLVQRMSAVGAMAQFYPDAPNALDVVDLDAVMGDIVTGTGPMKWKRKAEDLAAMRAEKVDAANAAKAEQLAMESGQALLKSRPETIGKVDQMMQEAPDA